jgi:hypothetical protein
MAGILDKKTRFIDLIVTQEGKRQIASGKLRAEYASLTDMHSFYNPGYTYSEVTDRIYFQPMERPEHSLVMEKDDSGKLFMFDHSPTGSIVGDAIFEKEAIIESDLHKLKIATGSQFASLSEGIEKTFLRHFQKNHFIASNDDIGDRDFTLSNNDLTFTITNTIPFENGPNPEVVNVNNAEPFMLDSKLAHLPNFQFLPPVNTDGSEYGSYTDIRNTNQEGWKDIISRIGSKAFSELNIDVKDEVDTKNNTKGDISFSKLFDNQSLRVIKEFKTINFEKTSKENNLMIQMFQKNKNLLQKLDIIDGGFFVDDNDPNEYFEKQVFYVGKIYLDDYNTPTFINLFTLIFD